MNYLSNIHAEKNSGYKLNKNLNIQHLYHSLSIVIILPSSSFCEGTAVHVFRSKCASLGCNNISCSGKDSLCRDTGCRNA